MVRKLSGGRVWGKAGGVVGGVGVAGDHLMSMGRSKGVFKGMGGLKFFFQSMGEGKGIF